MKKCCQKYWLTRWENVCQEHTPGGTGCNLCLPSPATWDGTGVQGVQPRSPEAEKTRPGWPLSWHTARRPHHAPAGLDHATALSGEQQLQTRWPPQLRSDLLSSARVFRWCSGWDQSTGLGSHAVKPVRGSRPHTPTSSSMRVTSVLVGDSKRHQSPCFLFKRWGYEPINKHFILASLGSSVCTGQLRIISTDANYVISQEVRRVCRWLSGEEPAWQCRRRRRCRFDPGVRKMPWRRRWKPTPGSLPGESHGHRSLGDYSPWGCKELDTTA